MAVFLSHVFLPAKKNIITVLWQVENRKFIGKEKKAIYAEHGPLDSWRIEVILLMQNVAVADE